MRINRICSKPEIRESRFNELKQMLLDRNYSKGMIDSAIQRARSISRPEALKVVVRPKTTRKPVCVVTWDSRLPSFSAISKRHWWTMTTTEPFLKEVFPQPPSIAFKRQTNMRDLLIQAKQPVNTVSRRKQFHNGMRKCGRQCLACPFVSEKRK